eukprot:CAMPEP_0179074384 /NCGR_PEP_ID=MMETSP0796-20121207/33058_1 /TAXON_ID=73915 /ORGANISM="Pyrodinium bahamense, Strain pbaha01" /LENGTH=153 /DNA_ID=CAMNT_0020771605 /DNA_START=64 /DNA_END=525 /DNA_ORIENTATION=-
MMKAPSDRRAALSRSATGSRFGRARGAASTSGDTRRDRDGCPDLVPPGPPAQPPRAIKSSPSSMGSRSSGGVAGSGDTRPVGGGCSPLVLSFLSRLAPPKNFGLFNLLRAFWSSAFCLASSSSASLCPSAECGSCPGSTFQAGNEPTTSLLSA